MVDVGGGVGHVALSLARLYPRLRIVLQDRAEVIVHAQAVSSFFAPLSPSNIKISSLFFFFFDE
jgi:16S rRNA G1207 methylase RsmC